MANRRRPLRRRLTKKQLAVAAKRWEREMFLTQHSLEVFYRGFDLATDRAIEKAAGGSREGSGMMVLMGLRDIRFEFKTERGALAAARRVKKAVRGTRFVLRSSRRV